MLNLTLRQLRYFDALARHRHFGRAAEACGISQPALSEQIKELEETFGAALFERGARQVRVTGFGEELSARVGDILRAIDDLDGLAANNRPLRRLRLGVIPTVAPYLLPAVVRDLNLAYPGLEIHLRETITPKLIEELVRGRIDAAVVALPISEAAFEEVPLFSEEFLLVRPSANQTAPPRDPEELADMPLLLLEEGHCFRDQALAVCGFNPLRPREALDASSLSTLVQMVGAGIGITLIPEMAVAVETRSAPVAVTRFSKHKPSRTIGMVWRRSNPLAEQLHLFAEVLRGCPAPRASKAPSRRKGRAAVKARRPRAG
jgi:LysR family hydrogen peroxide-inducible transcriptional activator